MKYNEELIQGRISGLAARPHLSNIRPRPPVSGLEVHREQDQDLRSTTLYVPTAYSANDEKYVLILSSASASDSNVSLAHISH